MADRNLQPSLADLMRRARELAADGIRVGVPARVTAYSAATRTVDCQPLPRRTGPTGTQLADPGLVEVPVVWPGTAAFRVRFPLRDGDLVWLMVADRNIDDVANAMLVGAASGLDTTSPVDQRAHDLSDCVALPVATFTAGQLVSTAAEADRLVVEAGAARLTMTEAGLVALGSGTVEALDLFDQLLARLQLATVATLLGPQPLDPATQGVLTTLRTSLATIRGTL